MMANRGGGVAQWLERGSLPLPAVWFQTPLGAAFSENYYVSPSQCLYIVSMFCPCARHFTFTCFIWLRCKWVPGKTEVTMRTQCAEMPAWLYAHRGVEMTHEWISLVKCTVDWSIFRLDVKTKSCTFAFTWMYFRHQNLTSVDLRFWRLKSIPLWKSKILIMTIDP